MPLHGSAPSREYPFQVDTLFHCPVGVELPADGIGPFAREALCTRTTVRIVRMTRRAGARPVPWSLSPVRSPSTAGGPPPPPAPPPPPLPQGVVPPRVP